MQSLGILETITVQKTGENSTTCLYSLTDTYYNITVIVLSERQ